MKTLRLLLGVGILFIMPTESQAQWQPDVRLTNDPAASWTSYNNAWCVAASGNIVHVVWYDNRDGNYEIYYKRSTDRGVNWGTDTRLTISTALSRDPSVAVSGSVVHVVWEEHRDGNPEIYFKRSTDDGVSWAADTRLTNNAAGSQIPTLAVSGSVVHVIWEDFRDGRGIYYKRSLDGGVNWGTDARLTSDTIWTSYFPSVAVSGSVVHLAWYDTRDGNDEIYYKRSINAGVNWESDRRLTNNAAISRHASVAVSGSVVHLVWHDDRDGNAEIYYKRSTDGGVSWSADTRLTSNSFSSYYPSIVVSGPVVHLVWEDNRDGLIYEIYYKRSTDGGVNWGADTRLTNKIGGSSSHPSVSVSDSVVHVVWYDTRDGNQEIYYKRNPTGNPVVGVRMIGSEIPQAFKLEQNYPNPFNPSTRIRFSIGQENRRIGEAEKVVLRVFDVLGREVATLVNEVKPPGEYEVVFDASHLASGVYYYQLKAGAFAQTRKLVLLR